MSYTVKLSVLIITCNHARFIEQAIDSVLMQQTDFDFEILISEDCSTDGTRQIVQAYHRKHPNRIRLLLSDQNLHNNRVVVRGIQAARGEYIALLDGDDCWSVSHKLQKQVDFLETHPECTVCFHNAMVVYEDGSRHPRHWTPPAQPEISTLEDIWMGNFIATCSTVFRRGAFGHVPHWYISLFPITDWPLHILNAEHGHIGYLNEVMGIYRFHGGGLYSTFSEARKLRETLKFYRTMNRNFNFKYSRLINTAITKYFFEWAEEYLARGNLGQARDCFKTCLSGRPVNKFISLKALLVMAVRLYKPRFMRRKKSVLKNQTHPYRAVIPGLQDNSARPLWSVMIPTYHCAAYLRETLTGVLAQDPGPALMQIEVVDDHSTWDDPAQVVAEIGRGRVGFYRQPENVGHIKNFETCLKRARGVLVHLLHGDDGVCDGFYQKMQQGFERRPDIGAAFCRQIFMDEHDRRQSISPLEQKTSGILDNALARLASEQRIMTPSIVVRRHAYERLGGFDARLICAEDWEMWVRIAAHYPIWYEVEPLAMYRMHSASNTGRHVQSGAERRYTRMAIKMMKSYLPEAIADKVAGRAKETYALSALESAHTMLTRHNGTGAVIQMKEALKFSGSLRVIRQMIRVIISTGIFRGREIITGRTGEMKD